MNNLSQSLRARLKDSFVFSHLTLATEQYSTDKRTRKTLFQLPDGAQIETVLMEYDKRRTVCVSTQAGCGMGCAFCATGQMGWQRNLTAGEIVEQALWFARDLSENRKSEITHIVFMGMGEPFVNYDNFMQAARRLNDPAGFNLGARRMTVSTVGIVPGIDKLAAEDLQINLAVSLHAATDELRNQLVPVNKRYSLIDLIRAVREYIARTHRRVSFEWALIEGVNDTPEQARALASWVKGMVCHVNLIPLNPTASYGGAASAPARLQAFCAVLEQAGIPHTVRLRRGIDIQAGCGQLRQREHPSNVRQGSL
jgi:23S rRNA (adenine2503-C2)-methyltransferase